MKLSEQALIQDVSMQEVSMQFQSQTGRQRTLVD